mmetsp:Transcript_22025/g.36380  ORF Transcript_22025/g.36380 Transcript_22025/m.36380 type:complete len:331 (-) Transcript_22025:331-1323(-)|eukprot:CAMPEP_0119299906 /NCGR_PEP_ID=MMETSP1333-20130426/1926_1 /TAXON_ID=418940 /ORGANISM="Scyphosphaera apsteinii, Strain RCC1455" /LENGTH=330 /DNA_ID=CAMNT_0007301499 /DNA_START=23 /DNA_END=1018 /DNA_ORIENTATION=-
MPAINFTPLQLVAMVKTFVETAQQREQLSALEQSYAAGQMNRSQLNDALAAIAGEETLLKVLRIMVPGYDEMCGRTPEPAPEPPIRSEQCILDSTSRDTPKLKKGFLDGGKRLASPADSAVAPSAAPANIPMSAMFAQQRQAHLESLDRETAALADNNDHVMHQAKYDGNQGNVVLTPNGSAVLRDDDSMGGRTSNYEWGQNETEVTVKCKAPKGLKARDVRLRAASKHLKFEVGGKVVVDGQLHRQIIADESTYSIEDDATSGEGERLVVLTLVKATKTGGKHHWSSVVEGDDAIDTARFGPQVLTADPNNPVEFAEHLKLLEICNSKR